MPASHRPLRTRSSRPSTCPAGQNQRGSSSEGLGLRFASILSWVAILIGGYLVIGDFVRPAPPSTAAPNTHRAAMRQSTGSTPRHLAIEEVRLGRRLAGRNPLREQVEEGLDEPNPAMWREIHLTMVKEHGSRIVIELLRPLNWIAVSDADEGEMIYLDLSELGIEGEAYIETIRPCPEIAPGAGTIVIGRFIHEVESTDVISLSIDGQAEPTGVTTNHPYWSVDRSEFVPAGELAIGELVETLFGIREITAIAPRRGPPVTRVYNIETLEHVYLVGDQGTLVHNSCATLSKSTGLVPAGAKHLGEWGEARLAIVLKGMGVKPSKPYATSLGYRYVDRVAGGIAHEAKAGVNVALTSKIRKQALKDAELIASKEFQAAHWHFFQNAQKETIDFLKNLGIQVTVH